MSIVRTDKVVITLTDHELYLAASVGMARQLKNVLKKRKDRNTPKKLDDPWTKHIEGAMGEAAVAKYLDKFWSGRLGDLGAADVGPYEVRTNTSQAKGNDLILKEGDNPAALFIHVISNPPDFTITGFMKGEEAQKYPLEERVKGRPSFFVPPEDLEPIKTLKEFL